jgi:hypothetical protein
MVATVLEVTAPVLMLNVALVAPAGTVIHAGTNTAARSRERFTFAPPLGAAAVRVTVPVAVTWLPPTSEVGAMDRLETETDGGVGLTVRNACEVSNCRLPLIVTSVLVVTVDVVTGNVARVAPAGTVTVAGTDAMAWLLRSGTDVPPLGAGVSMITVPVEELPPTTPGGSSVTARSFTGGGCGVTVSVAERETPPNVAVIATGVGWVTVWVVTLTNALVRPASTRTFWGTVAAAPSLESDTSAPPLGATPFSVTVAMTSWDWPPTTVAGWSDTEKTASGPAGAAAPGAGTIARKSLS